jgi:hypothetical protein
MRSLASLLCLVVVLSLATPAQAQLRETARAGNAPTKLYDSGANAGDLLGSLFGAEQFRMSHSYGMSFSSFGGQSSSMGMYTNSMMWQFNSAWAARVDVGVAHSLGGQPFGDQRAKVFLRNAEVAYRPSENMQVRLQVQQSPYGRYVGPYGGYGMHGSRFAPMQMNMRMQQTPTDELFWKN